MMSLPHADAGGFVVLASEPVDDSDTGSDSFDTIYGNGDRLLVVDSGIV